MTSHTPLEYTERWEAVAPFRMHVTTYRIDATWYCTVDDVDPGAVIARSKAPSREEAEHKATARARMRMELSAERFHQNEKRSQAGDQ